MSKNDGGAAYPGFQYTEGRGTHRMGRGDEWECYAPGMTLRDYFAAKALQGFMASKVHSTHFLPTEDANYCYRIADAMLAERAK